MHKELGVTKMLESKEIAETLLSEDECNRIVDSGDPIALISAELQRSNLQFALQMREFDMPQDIIDDFLSLSARSGRLAKCALERVESQNSVSE